ncbi:MAG: DUF2058 domain-containing protein [Venatoribacter sp.]
MAKSLQEQLLAAGLVDKNKAKKAAKELKRQDHLQRTGQENELDKAKAQAAQKLKEKAEQDKKLNAEREQEAQQRAIAAQVKQLVQSNAIKSTNAGVKYQFVDGTKVKAIYVDQAIFDRLSRGQLAIIALDLPGEKKYEVVALGVAEKIKQRKDNHFIYVAENTSAALAEDDPYAAYQIPDDLMW